MMHTMGISFGILWLLVPAVLIGVAIPVARTLVDRARSRSVAAPDQTRLTESNPDATIYRLAKSSGGVLTVSDVVVETGMPPKQAEETLERMVDGVRVRFEVGDDGIVRYEFAELRS